MIFCTERKIGIFFIPKCGSHTVFDIFKNLPIAHKKFLHVNYAAAVQAHDDISDFSSYKFYAFYRDPVERFNSAFKFHKRSTYPAALAKFFPEDTTEVFKLIRQEKYNRLLHLDRRHDDEYSWLPQDIKDKLESITVQQMLSLHPGENPDIKIFGSGIIKSPISLVHQKFWFDHDIDISYLNFSNFDSEIRGLASLFGINLETVNHLNEGISIENERQLTTEEIDLIKTAYQADYDFFASKGITFP